MALGFFRRHQKMVIIIMVVLMVSFLIGYKGLNMLFRSRRGDKPVGRTRSGEITFSQLSAAEADVRYLAQLGLGDRNAPYAPGKYEFIYLRDVNGDDAVLSYALLLDEARAAGTIVLKSDVDAFFAALKMKKGSAEYEARMSEFREQNIPSKRIRAAVARWLSVYKTYIEAQVDTPPSEPQALRYYRDANEKIALRVVRFKAKRFLKLKNVGKVTDRQIVEQFNAYRTDFPGVRASLPLDKFAFGYRQPSRVRIDYLFIALEPIVRAVRVTDIEVMNYWKAHKSEFVRREAVSRPAAKSRRASASAPSTQATKPAGPKVEYRTVVLKFSEAYGRAKRLVKRQIASQIIQEVLAQAQEVLGKIESDASVSPGQVYEKVRRAMIRDAKKRLARKIKVRIVNQPLDRAIDILAEKSGVGICFPWGLAGTWKLADPKAVKVSLKGGETTLGGALANIVSQIKGWPALSWSSCRGIHNPMIFPTAGVAYFPVVAGRTDLVDYRELANDDLLGSCYSSPREGRRLGDIAFMAAELVGAKRGQIRAGDKGPRMYARGDRPGLLLWRLMQAVPSHVLNPINTPEALNAKLRKRVTSDAEIRAGYAVALKRAEALKKLAASVGLEKAAKAGKLDSFVTGLFSRRTAVGKLVQEILRGRIDLGQALPSLLDNANVRGSIVSTLVNLGIVQSYAVPDEVIAKLLAASSQLRFRVFYGLLMDRSTAMRMIPSIVKGVSLPTRAVRAHFMRTAFSLVPKNVEPPYSKKPYALAVAPLPVDREVLVLQREDYRPIIRSKYESSGRSLAMQALQFARMGRSSRAWFRMANIAKRLGFVREKQ